MWVKILLMRQDQFIMISKRKKKNIYGNASKKDLEELKEEGIEIQAIPWVDDKDN